MQSYFKGPRASSGMVTAEYEPFVTAAAHEDYERIMQLIGTGLSLGAFLMIGADESDGAQIAYMLNTVGYIGEAYMRAGYVATSANEWSDTGYGMGNIYSKDGARSIAVLLVGDAKGVYVDQR